MIKTAISSRSCVQPNTTATQIVHSKQDRQISRIRFRHTITKALADCVTYHIQASKGKQCKEKQKPNMQIDKDHTRLLARSLEMIY